MGKRRGKQTFQKSKNDFKFSGTIAEEFSHHGDLASGICSPSSTFNHGPARHVEGKFYPIKFHVR
jgi:hypothetical protein